MILLFYLRSKLLRTRCDDDVRLQRGWLDGQPRVYPRVVWFVRAKWAGGFFFLV
jgi:hypothetical protein